jgi:hypothetical protein
VIPLAAMHHHQPTQGANQYCYPGIASRIKTRPQPLIFFAGLCSTNTLLYYVQQIYIFKHTLPPPPPPRPPGYWANTKPQSLWHNIISSNGTPALYSPSCVQLPNQHAPPSTHPLRLLTAVHHSPHKHSASIQARPASLSLLVHVNTCSTLQHTKLQNHSSHHTNTSHTRSTLCHMAAAATSQHQAVSLLLPAAFSLIPQAQLCHQTTSNTTQLMCQHSLALALVHHGGCLAGLHACTHGAH